MKLQHASCLLLPFALSLGVLEAQDEPARLAERLRILEEKAGRSEALEAKVVALESRLRDYESEEVDAQLEAAINALRGDTEAATVSARKARSIVLGGQLRLRSDYRTVSLYGAPRPSRTDEDLTIQRTRVNFDARLLDDVRVFVEIQDTRTWGEEQTVLANIRGVDLHQGYADFEKLFGSPMTLRTGRTELSLWNQRLISPLDWSAQTRSFDGVVLMGTIGEFDSWSGFHAVAEDPIVDSDKDTDLYWTALTYRGWEGHEIGGAVFYLHSNTGSVDLSFGTATLHAQGRFGGFDYSADGVLQWGDNEERDVHAYAFALTAGYNFDGGWKPRLGLEWTYATGDSDPTDDELETFNPLFPFSHFYQGYLDVVAWQNSHDVALHFEVTPAESWWAEVAFHAFWLDTPNDAWFSETGAPIRPGAPGAGHELGQELDVSAKYWMSKDVFLWFGYSHFFPGSFVSDTGSAPDTDWVWLQLTANF